MSPSLSSFIDLVAAVCFILAIRGLSSPKTARKGNLLGMIGMGLAICVAFFEPQIHSYTLIVLAIGLGWLIGVVVAKRVQMTALPQLIAAFNSLGGLASVLVAWASFLSPEILGISVMGALKTSSLLEMSLGTVIGAVTFTGSLIAFAKLQGLMSGKALSFKNQNKINAFLGGVLVLLIVLFAFGQSNIAFLCITALALALGILLIIPIGGADMPVVISMLNSYSGWAAALIGFTLQNSLLIITGALVGSSGAILSYIMCKAMNRSILHVMFGSMTASGESCCVSVTGQTAKVGDPEEASDLLKNATKVIIVPGYGMAVAQAQFSLNEMAETLKKMDIDVKYAIHPVAGRMPGHMNVLLAEAKIPYEDVFELDDINSSFSNTDVVYIIGANDVTNPLAKTDPTSSIYGMPVLDVEKARSVIVVKRSLGGTGYAGLENPLFFAPNTIMLLGDAKKVTEAVVQQLKS